MFLGSHSLSFWLGVRFGGNDLEGNPLDLMVYTLMILASMAIVSRRGLALGRFISANKSIILYFLILGATILWAEYPFVTFKRWIKETGAIFVILIILTEDDPLEAIEAVFLRCAYVLLPLSVVFIKYVPSLGRVFTHDGIPQYVGVTQQKNSLGEIVLVFGSVILWSMLREYERQERKTLREFVWPALVLCMGFWLLNISNSMTAMLCLGVAAVILFGHKLPFLKTRPRFALFLFLGALPLIILLKSSPEISDPILRALGRNPTLTNRTKIWQAVREHPVDPLIGCGYMMFWDINKTIHIDESDVSLKTVHNGYLETYVDGGFLGLAVLFFMLICLGVRAAKVYSGGSDYGKLLLAFFVVTLLYNLSESVYARRCPLWFSFLLICIGGSSLFSGRLCQPQAEPDDVPDESVEYSVA